jgi:serine/threonine protein kinase/Flp pilus assembly protein TadD
MTQTTACPDPLHLRLFHNQPSGTHEADVLREHIRRCQACRAIVAELVDVDDNDDTLGDESLTPTEQELSAEQASARQTNEIIAALEDRDYRQITVVGRAFFPAGDVLPPEDSTVILPERGTAAALEGADHDFATMAGSAVAAGMSVQSSADTTVIFLKNDTAPRTDVVEANLHTMADPALSPRDPLPLSAADTTVLWAERPAENGDSLGFADSAEVSAEKRERYSLNTQVMLSTDESGQVVRSDTATVSDARASAGGSKPAESRLAGVAVPGYDILEELGRGGMGVVYKARQRRLQRLVALKMVLAGAHVGAVGLARFRAEAEAVAKLLHSNIVQIYETGEHEGRPYFSLEFVDGGSLDQRMRESPTTPRAAARLVETLARTMDVAHQRGIVHRDLKPANILLAKLGNQSSVLRQRETDSTSLPANHWSRTTTPKIADFGLAKRVDEESSQTQSGTILGTPSYMAPEQAGGKNKEIGPAVDIYSLGAILYELLVGRPPFKAGSPIDTVRQVIEQEPVPPRQLEPRVPPDLETICLKCLEKDPLRRFGTAGDLAEDLRRFLEGEPILARPTPTWERAWKWGKRRPYAVAIMGLTAAILVGAGLFIVWHNVSLRGQLDIARTEERMARQREHDAVETQRQSAIKQEGQKLFDSARVAVAARDWSSARLDLEKALTTIGYNPRMDDLREPAQALLRKAEQELGIEADRRASQTRYQKFTSTRDEAHFLGTLYTGMDFAANLEAARTSVHAALAVYDVLADGKAQPKLDAYLSSAQKSEIQGDCYQLLLILAETEAQSAAIAKPPLSEKYLRKALGVLDQARRFGEPSRAFHLRRARYLNMLDAHAEVNQAEQAAKLAGLDRVLDHFLMADELYRCEKFGEAIHEFEQVLASKPGHFWAQYINAICLLRTGRPAEARTLLSACLAQRSDFAWLYLLQGFAQEELQAWDAAESDFQKASQLPLDDNARYVLFVSRGVLRIRQERFKEAVADLKLAIELKPKAYQAYVNLAQAYRRLDKPDLALKQLNRAVQLEPALAHVYRLRAKLYLERNEPLLALDNFNEAIRRENTNSPYRVDDHVERGRLLLSKSNPKEALACVDAALALQKDHLPAQRIRAECLFRLGRFEEVIAAFDEYLRTGKPLESIYRGRGLARAELGQYPGAIEDFTKALELHPTAVVQAYRGWTHLVVDAPKLALRDFELAIKLDPQNGDAYNGRGFALASLGRYREAMHDAAEAIRLGPPSPRLYYNAARVYAQCPGTGPQRALEMIQRALSILPERERRPFWAAHIRADSAMAALRRYPLFAKLAVEMSR